MEASGGSVSFWGKRKTLHIVLAVITFGLWLLALLALYLWRKGRKGWSIAIASVLGLIVLLIGIGSASSPETNTTAQETTVEETNTTRAEVPTTEETTPTASTPKGRVREAVGSEVDASGWAGTVQVQDVSFDGNEAQVTLTTPEGGFEGASCGDLSEGAKAVFVKVYDAAAWNGGAVVVFKGGLVDTTTGQPIPDVNTGIFTMPAGQAARINWSDEDALFNIDWSYYRDFCHPALK